MIELNLLKSLPKAKRNVQMRTSKKTEEHIRISREYGKMYFDGPREYGYGGYKYDGRWIPVAKDIVKHFNLKKNNKVLDIGCGKGFLVKDLLNLGIDAYGIDVSQYALENCEKEVVGRLKIGSAEKLPFPDNSFDAVISINTIHNLSKSECLKAVQEIERLAPGKGFIQVDSYKNEEQKKIFESWVLTAKYYGYPEEWKKLYLQAGYTGFYYWTIIE
jgi:SAM-dependent methyltransferase|tara:strand:+ start:336 stop:986 length:651 start_codon:yes stop_codon:yes gene_type:complete